MGKRKKRKLKTGRVLRCLLLVVVLFSISFGCFSLLKGLITKEKLTISYIASTSPTIDLYDLEFNKKETLVRGTEVETNNKIVKNNDQEFQKIIYEGKSYLIKPETLSLTKEEIVKETEMYVRTSLTVYKDLEGTILGFLKKGTKVTIKGYDKIDSDGLVNMYKIDYEGKDGYIYRKYLVDNETSSLLNYDQDGNYQKHLSRSDHMNLGGGEAGTLDYYPYEKPKFKNNTIPEEARTLYLTGYGSTISNIDKYIELAKNSYRH